jgi:DeoR/GlpR family transcriptional regulator of sugar metabolism
LLTTKRHSLIRKIVSEKSLVSVAELAEKCCASEVTIRRDLTSLEKDGIVTRVRGGAILADLAPDYLTDRFKRQYARYHEEKHLIGVTAANLIEPDETIIIDAGSTTLELSKNLAKTQGVTIFTPSIKVAEELEHYTGITTILTGGTLRSMSSSLLNPVLDKSLYSVMASKVFLGVNGISIQHGLTAAIFAEADVKKILIDHAQEIIVLADSSKLDNVAPAFIGNLDKINTLVTDYKANPAILDTFRAMNIKVIVAHPS